MFDRSIIRALTLAAVLSAGTANASPRDEYRRLRQAGRRVELPVTIVTGRTPKPHVLFFMPPSSHLGGIMDQTWDMFTRGTPGGEPRR